MRVSAGNIDLEVRPGTVEDIPLLLSFISSMAEYEGPKVTATEEVLRESLFGSQPAAHVLLAFVGGQPAAYAVYFYAFSTMAGKRTLWLEDIFISPAFRRKGIARALMAYLASVAVENKCARLEWIVLDWNDSAIAFYKRLGAVLLDDWRICRLDEEGISDLARQP